MAYDVLQRDQGIAFGVLAHEMEIRDAWAETIYREAPPPRIYEWANPRYAYSLAKESALHRRLGYLATFLFEEQIIPKPVDVRSALDASVITEALRNWKRGQ